MKSTKNSVETTKVIPTKKKSLEVHSKLKEIDPSPKNKVSTRDPGSKKEITEKSDLNVSI